MSDYSNGTMFGNLSGITGITQTNAGWVITFLIAGIFVLYLIMSTSVLSYFSGIKRKAARLRSGKTLQGKEPFFSDVQEDFEAAMKKGVRDVGETGILDEAVSPSVKLFEYFIHYLPTLATLTGLLGTFLGLTGAIGQMDLNVDRITDIEAVIDSINAPMADMSTAFYTSLVGIMASAVMNVFERVTRLYQRSAEALTEVRDYINIEFQSQILSSLSQAEKAAIHENDPTAIAWNDASRRISKVLSGLKESVDQMSADVTSLESRGISLLSSNIASLIKTYQIEHDDVRSVNESMRAYLNMLQDLGRAMDQNNRVFSRSEELLEQLAATYRMLAEEHRLYEGALSKAVDTDLLKMVRDQLHTLIAR